MIVIPMAGLSSRFKKAGYNVPKYMLKAHNKTIFEHAVNSFKNYFDTQNFLFIALNMHGTEQFINDKCMSLGIKNYKVVFLDRPTKGQAETVYLGLKQYDKTFKQDITIFNIDTFRPNFSYPEILDFSKIDGYLETFIGSGTNWSNILPDNTCSMRVKFTAEKQEISEYCCTGLYYFSSADVFCKAFEEYTKINVQDVDAGEYYIAPLYNILIANGLDIFYSVIEKNKIIFCGIPDEYITFKNKESPIQE